jgi:hypothetical protein
MSVNARGVPTRPRSDDLHIVRWHAKIWPVADGVSADHGSSSPLFRPLRPSWPLGWPKSTLSTSKKIPTVRCGRICQRRRQSAHVGPWCGPTERAFLGWGEQAKGCFVAFGEPASPLHTSSVSEWWHGRLRPLSVTSPPYLTARRRHSLPFGRGNERFVVGRRTA